MAQPAVSTPTPPPVKADHDPTPQPPPSPPPQIQIKQETNPPTTTTTSNSLPSQETPPSLPSIPPPFTNSITQLNKLSTALSAFQTCYNDLQNHLNSLQSTIDSQLTPQKSNLSSPPHQIIPIITPQSNPFQEQEQDKEKEKPINQSEVESLCIMMSSRGLRRYMVINISEPNKLREEVPKALKLSSNPAKLVLETSGRFFMQGRKAYVKDSPMIPAREASVLVLECFLLMRDESGNDGGVIKIEKGVQDEAEEAAILWRKRLISEGGLSKACEIDARGLLFFLGCFGIPGLFRNEDFGDMFRAGNVKEISGVLKRSSILMTKFSDIIGWMVKNKMVVDAVDIACTFGFEDKFNPQKILTSFLRESKESWKRTKRSSQGSWAAVNEANKKQLAAMQALVKCLESHGIDPSKLLPGWQINEKIKSLEKDIADSEKNMKEKTVQKRKADEAESSRLRNQEVKRSRYIDQGLQQQKVTVHIDGDRSMLDGLHGYVNRSFVSPSVLHRAGAGLLPESIGGSIAGIGGGASDGISPSATGVLQTGSYAGVHSGALVDATGQIVHCDGHPYGLRGDAALGERLPAHTYTGQPPSYGLTTLYRASPSLEGFPGLPSNSTVAVAHRSAASDLYRFADAVGESESYHSSGSRNATAVPPVVPSHHSSSYLY